LLVPIGGGGLISGMAVVAKAINPACQVIGIELDVACAFQTSVRAGKLVEIVAGPSLADGLGGNPDPETITFAYIQRLVDRIDTVSEADLAAAIAGLVAHEHVVAEGAGAATTAAIVGRRTDVRGRRVGGGRVGVRISIERASPKCWHRRPGPRTRLRRVRKAGPALPDVRWRIVSPRSRPSPGADRRRRSATDW
jgi:threonine dehydratase